MTVHVADLADFFLRALEDDSARGYYVIGDARIRPLPRSPRRPPSLPALLEQWPGSDEEARARLGDYFAEVLLLDQGTDAARARGRIRLGGHPHGGLVDELREGELAQARGRTLDHSS